MKVDDFVFPSQEKDIKKELISFMHTSGLDWIYDVDYKDGVELVASKTQEGDLWWRPLTVEGQGFTQLFQGSVRAVSHGKNHE